ncbi:MAG TPA: hypothetical protein VE172_09970 [Stackebrandtia sp.]|nr:hypothetical protein [Stackebrandtia sp.]HZE39123.1 hypothetical protein [Stackebrandtia sp.]
MNPEPKEPDDDTAGDERDGWRDTQDDPWSPDEKAPPPVIGE